MPSKKPTAQLRKPSRVALSFIEGTEPPKETAPEKAPPAAKQTAKKQPKAKTATPKEKRSTAPSKENRGSFRWRRTVLTTAKGDQMKRLTLYLPNEMALRWAELCDDNSKTMSERFRELVEQDLSSQ